MKFGYRKPSIKRSIKARTTGKIKRATKKAVNPLYGKKGMGIVNNPKKAVYNKIYNKTTIDATKPLKQKNKQHVKIGDDTYSVSVRIVDDSIKNDNELIYNQSADALQEVFDKYSYYGQEKHVFNNKIINDYKDSSDPNDNLAVAISYLGEGANSRKNAIVYFEKYLKNPTNQTYFDDWFIYSSLANLCESEYLFDNAINYLKKAIVANNSSNYADFTRIGNILLKKDVNLAIEYYENLKNETIYKKHKKVFDTEYKKMLEKKTKGYVYRPRKKCIRNENTIIDNKPLKKNMHNNQNENHDNKSLISDNNSIVEKQHDKLEKSRNTPSKKVKISPLQEKISTIIAYIIVIVVVGFILLLIICFFIGIVQGIIEEVK